MRRRTMFAAGITAAVACTAILGVPKVIAQMAPPTESKGVAGKVIGTMALRPEIPDVGDRQLRMRVVTLAPGGVFAVHSHKDRPSVEFVLKGSAIEYRGEAKKEYKEGDSLLADKDTVHWWRNDGSEPAIFIAVDVFNPPK